MTEYTLKLSPDTRDLVFDNEGVMVTIDGDTAYTQNVQNTLNTWLGEFMLDETHGTDYSRILSHDYYDAMSGEAEEIIRDGIFQEPNVSLVNRIEVAISQERALTASFDGELASGETISLEELTQYG